MAGNPVGGQDQGVTQLNSTGVNFGADLDKLAGLEGLTFFTSLSVRSGTSLTLSKIHNVINVQQLYGNESYRLVNLYLEQVLLDGHFAIKAGRIAQFDDFSHSDAFAFYMNNAFDGQPIGFFFMGSFNAYPVTTWGALIRGGVRTGDNDGFYGMAGAYGADNSLADVDKPRDGFQLQFQSGGQYHVRDRLQEGLVQERDGPARQVRPGRLDFYRSLSHAYRGHSPQHRRLLLPDRAEPLPRGHSRAGGKLRAHAGRAGVGAVRGLSGANSGAVLLEQRAVQHEATMSPRPPTFSPAAGCTTGVSCRAGTRTSSLSARPG